MPIWFSWVQAIQGWSAWKQHCRKNLSVPVETKLNTIQQCSLKAKVAISLLACIRKSTSSRLRNMILSLYSALVRYAWSAGFNLEILENLALSCREEIWTYLSSSSKRATKMVKSLEHPPYTERLRELGLFSLKKRRLRTILLMCINNSWKVVNKTRQDFAVVSSDWQWAQIKVQEMLFKHKKILLYCEGVEHWHRLPREAVESPLLEISKPHLDMTLRHQI